MHLLPDCPDPLTAALADLRSLVEQSTWTFARTMPRYPHEYTLRRHAKDELLFERVVLHIRRHGYTKLFGETRYTYLDLDGWQYWTMGAPLQDTILINRARIRSAGKRKD